MGGSSHNKTVDDLCAEVEALQTKLNALREENKILRSQEIHGRDLRQYNIILELTAAIERSTPTIERLSRDNATWAKALYDMVPIVETKHDQLLSASNVQHAGMREALDKHIADVHSVVQEIRGYVVDIAKATAVTSNDATDAKNAALAAREATGQHPKAEAEGAAGIVDKGAGWWAKWSTTSKVLFIVLVGVAGVAFGAPVGAWLNEHLGGHHEKAAEKAVAGHEEATYFEPAQHEEVSADVDGGVPR